MSWYSHINKVHSDLQDPLTGVLPHFLLPPPSTVPFPMTDFPFPFPSLALLLSLPVLTSTSGGQEFPGIGAGTMLFLSGRGAAGAGPSGWTRIAPWMRTTGDTGANEQEKEIRDLYVRRGPCVQTHS